MNFGVRSKNRPFRMPPGLVGVTKTRTPKRYVIGEDPYISSYDQAEDLLKSPDVLQGDEISYSSNNQQGAWTAKVVGRGARKTLKFETSYADMFFGKKGDAKKAMKLMWKEGITLKQAWKRVKGKDKKSKKEAMSSKKKKAVANAKKAMRMHHREGITLKQAWKRVNRRLR